MATSGDAPDRPHQRQRPHNDLFPSTDRKDRKDRNDIVPATATTYSAHPQHTTAPTIYHRHSPPYNTIDTGHRSPEAAHHYTDDSTVMQNAQNQQQRGSQRRWELRKAQLISSGEWLLPTVADSYCDAGLLEGHMLWLRDQGPVTVVSVIRHMSTANHILVQPRDDAAEPRTVTIARKGKGGQPWLVSAAEAPRIDQVALLTTEYKRLRASSVRCLALGYAFDDPIPREPAAAQPWLEDRILAMRHTRRSQASPNIQPMVYVDGGDVLIGGLVLAAAVALPVVAVDMVQASIQETTDTYRHKQRQEAEWMTRQVVVQAEEHHALAGKQQLEQLWEACEEHGQPNKVEPNYAADTSPAAHGLVAGLDAPPPVLAQASVIDTAADAQEPVQLPLPCQH
eukprot:COSAG02_NODE_4218_length_5619_cov_1.862138_3_plen_396_part_00